MAREIGGGWESGNIVAEGFTGTGAGAINNTAGNQHKDRTGSGGTWCVVGGASAGNPVRNRFQATNNVRSLVEAWDRAMVYCANTTATDPGYVYAYYNGGTEIASIRLVQTTQQVQAFMGTATLLASSATGVFPVNRYFVLDIHYRMLDVNGLFEVYVDGVLVLTFSGDTKSGADAVYNTLGVGVQTQFNMDEYARNSITLEYDTGVGGVPTAGQTVTGGASGATAVITAVEGNAVSGVLVLQQWNGTSFQDNEAVTTPGLLNAQVNAPTAKYVSGFQPNSTRIGESFVVALSPNAVGATSGLTSSSGNPNWQNVDDVPPNTTDYNFGAVANLYDTYGMSDLPASANEILWVGGYNYCMRDNATLMNQRHVVRLGGVDYFSVVDTALPTAFGPLWYSWNVSPATLTAWTVGETNGAEAGFQVRT